MLFRLREMNRPIILLAVFALLWCFSFARADESAETSPLADTPPPSEVGAATSSSRADMILDRVKEAEEECNKVSMKDFVETDGQRITARPVALCAYKESDRSWHVIRLAIVQPVPNEYKQCVASAPDVASRRDCSLPYRVLTQGYRVEHLAGYGIARTIFNVSQDGEHLVVYRTRHVWFDDAALASGDPARIISTARAVNNTPYHPDFFDRTLVRSGREFLHLKARHALRALRERAVVSKAYPEEFISDVVPEETPVALAIIEQSDDKKFLEDPKGTIEAVLIEYALNGRDAFKWAQSSANALGAMQFTGGTYLSIANEVYVSAGLDPDFGQGARDLDNAVRAAICLIDYEVANFSSIPEVAKLFRDDPLLGGIYPVAAYNGGHGWAKKLHRWVKSRNIDLENPDVEMPRALVNRKESCPCRMIKTSLRGKDGKRTVITRKVMKVIETANTETPGYVKKYLYVVNYLADPERNDQ
jgi:hypothetical protein